MPKRRPRRATPAGGHVVALAYDGLCTFEFAIAVEIFGLPRPEMQRWYGFEVCSAERVPLAAVGGVQVTTFAGLEALGRADTIVIPGWRDIHERPPPALVAALRAAHRRGVRIMSICSGVFVLAATGLLDGKRATTHWRYAETLRAMHPRIDVDADVLYVDGGSLLTSAGGAAGIDLCLHVVRRDFGARIANQVARRLIIVPHRDGDQAQFVDRPIPPPGTRFAPLFDWARRHLDENLTIAALARRAAMSPRNFMRRFREATGSSPAEWLIGERIARARDLLEQTALSVEQVATACGFGSTDTLRHHFRRRLKLSPRRYRERFGVRAA